MERQNKARKFEQKIEVTAFRIANVRYLSDCVELSDAPASLGSVKVDKITYRRLRPSIGQYLAIHTDGSFETFSAAQFYTMFNASLDTSPTGESATELTGTSPTGASTIEAAAMQAYEVWRMRFPNEKIKGELAPPSDVLFNLEAYEYHALAWLDAAEQAQLDSEE